MRNVHEIRTVRCAHCGQVRREEKHWFVISTRKGRFRCVALIEGQAGEAGGGDNGWRHASRGLLKSEQPACGQHCAQKLFERYLSSAAIESYLDSSVHVSQGTE